MSRAYPTLLVVEDDPDFAAALCHSLRAAGYSVQRARSADEALRLARLHDPDLAIVDIMMNERTEGFFCIQRLRRLPGLADLPIIVVTALYESGEGFDVRPERSWVGHDAFFNKPVDPARLLVTIAELLDPERTARPTQESGRTP